MPSFQDPVSDGAEACTALRALAHATRTFDNPAQTYEVVGDLLGGLRSLEQVLDQLALAHTNADAIARTDDGDHWAGVEEAHAAALALRRASTLVARAGLALDRASQHSGRIAWDSLSTPSRSRSHSCRASTPPTRSSPPACSVPTTPFRDRTVATG